MKTCLHCNNQAEDTAVFCCHCGTPFAADGSEQQTTYTPPQQTYYQPPTQSPYTPVFDPYDHTAEFDAKDISENKVVSMLVYLMGPIGIIIALLVGNHSPYVSFHVRQALKFMVVEILATIIMVLLFWTAIAVIAYAVFMCALLIIKIVCFFQICGGKAKEPAIIRGLDFLK